MVYYVLSIAIITEVSATLLLKLSNGWEKWGYGMASIALYSVAGCLLAFVLKKMNVGLAYAIWSGMGIGLVCMASVIFWSQKLDGYAALGITMIAIGTLMITLKSSSLLV